MSRISGWDAAAVERGRANAFREQLYVLWSGKWLVAVVVGLALVLGNLYYFRTPPRYQSTAQVLLIKKEAAVAGGGETPRQRNGYGAYEDTISTHMLLIASPLIVNTAVEKYHLDSLSSLPRQPATTAAIIASLKTARAGTRVAPDPNVIVLSFEGTQADDCRAVLEALLDSYRTFLHDTSQNASEETVSLFRQAKDVLYNQLEKKEAAYRVFRQSAPLLWKGNDGTNLHEGRLTEIEQTRSQALLACADLECRLETFERAVHAGGSPEMLRGLLEKPSPGDGRKRERDPLETEMLNALLEEKRIAYSYGPEHPQMRNLRERVRLTRSLLGLPPSADGGSARDLVEAHAAALRQELFVARQKLAKYDRLFASEQESARGVSTFQVQDELYRSEIDRTRQLFASVMKRLDELNLHDEDHELLTKVIAPATDGVQVQPQAVRVFGAAGLLGLGAGVGLVYALRLLDRRYQGPQEIRQELGLPVLGHIPAFESVVARDSAAYLNGPYAALDPMLCTLHEPLGAPAEAYRGVRTVVCFNAEAEKLRILQVTSANPGDGKTLFAVNLALSLADSGKRVLLVDADLRLPRVHECLGLPQEPGLNDVLRKDYDLQDVLQEAGVRNLAVLTRGAPCQRSAELLTSPRFEELLESQRLRYDFVIVDTPPLLAVTDPAIIAARTDAVLLVTRLNREARETMSRAVEILRGLNAKILGVVVNGIGHKSSYATSYAAYGEESRYQQWSPERYYCSRDDRERLPPTDERRLAAAGDAAGNASGTGRLAQPTL